jgi:hypothetical protein
VGFRVFPTPERRAYLSKVVTVVRAVRVVSTLVLVALVVSFVIGLARPETGVVEKAVLLALILACVSLAARISLWSTRTQARLRQG